MIRTTKLHGPLAAAALAVLATTIAADEIRLRDGRVLIGDVLAADDRGGAEELRIRLRDGSVVTVAAADVAGIRSDDELRRELDQLAKENGGPPHAELGLAGIARRYGLEAEMWRHLGACLREAPDGTVRERLDDFLATLEPELTRHATGLGIEARVRDLLAASRPGGPAIRRAAAEAVLATLQGDDADAELRRRARGAGSPSEREAALRVLTRRGVEHDRFVWRTAVADRSKSVREEAARLARESGRAEQAIAYLAPGLGMPRADLRIRTAEAFAAIGSPAAIAPLVVAGPAAAAAAVSPGSTRGHVAILDQAAYVRDFDVEVAASAFIADPKIDVVQSGSVLDATVLAVQNVRTRIVSAYRRAIRSLAGEDPGRDPERWAEWFAAHAELVAAADALPIPDRPRPAPGAGGAPFRGPVGGGGRKGGGGGGGGTPADPEQGLGGLGTPVLPGTLPPLPGTSFPPSPPPIVRPVPIPPRPAGPGGR